MDKKTLDKLHIPAQQSIGIDVPEEFDRLPDLAYNLWWSWNPRATRLFSFLGPDRWNRYRNPIEVMMEMDSPHWYPLLNNEEFISLYSQVIQDFDEYMDKPGNGDGFDYPGPVAYFSTEYGLHDCLPIYSGGLGVLSGDHMKAASDRRVPLVGVGLLYRHGYFEQCIDSDGTQHHVLPRIDFSRLPLQQVLDRRGRPLVIKCPLRSDNVKLRVWKVQVGHVPVLLLDSDFAGNPPEMQPITGQLYVRQREMRLCQEIVLGVGGTIALEKLNIDPAVWHLNEGHSVFLVTERMRKNGAGNKKLSDAMKEISQNTLFTTHTPVTAGHERYSNELIDEYFEDFCEEIDVDIADFQALGHTETDSDDVFNLTAFALRASRRTNGVSKLHGEVTANMWGHLLEEDELFSITNGIHMPTWIGFDNRDAMSAPEVPWDSQACDKLLSNLEQVSDRQLWKAHKQQKERMIRNCRFLIREQWSRHGQAPDELNKIKNLINPDALLIGFARRFATYKRADLIFRDLERAKDLFVNTDRPVQIIFAGKAHPADGEGQALIKQIYEYMNSDGLGQSIIFLENYDMNLANHLVQGVDVWLNSPRRPNEASGTSGMKAALNGVLNLSISDGWWAEGFNGENGWKFGVEEVYDDHQQQDDRDADELYSILESEVIPTFYDRDEKGVPAAWVQKMRSSIRTVIPQFSSNRMVEEYEKLAYRKLLS